MPQTIISRIIDLLITKCGIKAIRVGIIIMINVGTITFLKYSFIFIPVNRDAIINLTNRDINSSTTNAIVV